MPQVSQIPKPKDMASKCQYISGVMKWITHFTPSTTFGPQQLGEPQLSQVFQSNFHSQLLQFIISTNRTLQLTSQLESVLSHENYFFYDTRSLLSAPTCIYQLLPPFRCPYSVLNYTSLVFLFFTDKLNGCSLPGHTLNLPIISYSQSLLLSFSAPSYVALCSFLRTD